MANTSSAKKAQRASVRKHVMNQNRRRAMKGSIKDLEKAVAGKGADAAKALSSVFQAIDKALKTGVIKKNTAARMKSRLSKMVSKK